MNLISYMLGISMIVFLLLGMNLTLMEMPEINAISVLGILFTIAGASMGFAMLRERKECKIK